MSNDRIWLPIPDPDKSEYWYRRTEGSKTYVTHPIRVSWGIEVFEGADKAIIGNNLYTDEVSRIVELAGVEWSALTDEEIEHCE